MKDAHPRMPKVGSIRKSTAGRDGTLNLHIYDAYRNKQIARLTQEMLIDDDKVPPRDPVTKPRKVTTICPATDEPED